LDGLIERDPRTKQVLENRLTAVVQEQALFGGLEVSIQCLLALSWFVKMLTAYRRGTILRLYRVVPLEALTNKLNCRI